MERGDRLRVGERRERRARGTPDACGTGSADPRPQVVIKTEQEEEPGLGGPPAQRERGILHAPGTGAGWPDVKHEIVVKVEPDDESYVGYPQGLGDRDLPGYPSTGIKAEPEDDAYGECAQHYGGGDGPDDPFCDANPEIIVKVEPDDESAIGYPQGLSEGRIPGYPSPAHVFRDQPLVPSAPLRHTLSPRQRIPLDWKPGKDLHTPGNNAPPQLPQSGVTLSQRCKTGGFIRCREHNVGHS
ncbi:uncharacterized protein LOC120398519 isoform X2 [Mauremys reevesii]|uniref:uncharacterized protein LOC120398519 isoform X2 n=1 Tax=Mauremys reevesii TaxID=260615 RepID=UPI00193EDEC8|nr:uncharacterized protein LOC120398519 isoform X2 [Mauremys reevesii]